MNLDQTHSALSIVLLQSQAPAKRELLGLVLALAPHPLKIIQKFQQLPRGHIETKLNPEIQNSWSYRKLSSLGVGPGPGQVLV